MLRVIVAACIGFVALAVTGGRALAATEWSAEPEVKWQSQHNTNPYLSHDKERIVITHRLDLNLPLIGESAVTELRLEPQFHFIRNPNWSELDRNEYAIGVGARRATELGNYGLKGDYTRDTTLTSEFLDTGYVGVKKQRSVWSLNPYLNMQLAPTINMRAGLQYKKQNYQDAEATPLVGYGYVQANAAVSHVLDDYDEVSCGVDQSRMRTERVISDDTGLHCSLVREMAESLRGTLTLGGHRTSTTSAFGAQSRSGLLAALEVAYETSDVRWGLRASRSIEPSGYGLLVRTDQLGLSASYDISERLSGSASIAANRYVMTTPGYDLPGRDYGDSHWRMAWQLLPEWTLEGGVDFSRQRYDNEISYAGSTTMIVQLTYRPDKIKK